MDVPECLLFLSPHIRTRVAVSALCHLKTYFLRYCPSSPCMRSFAREHPTHTRDMATSAMSAAPAERATETPTVLFWNVAQTNVHEKHEGCTWDERKDAAKAYIHRVNADIVVLTALRSLASSDETLLQFLQSVADASGYGFVYRPYCHYADALHEAVLFRSAMFYPGATMTHALLPDVKDSRCLMVQHLQSKASLQWLVIAVTHFPLDEARKWTCVKFVRQWLAAAAAEASKSVPTLLCASTNFFDGGGDGVAQRAMLNEVTEDVFEKVVAPSGDALGGTYFGYPYDKHRVAEGNLFKPVACGYLLNSSVRDPPTSPYLSEYRTNSVAVADTRPLFPSDHLGVRFSVSLS